MITPYQDYKVMRDIIDLSHDWRTNSNNDLTASGVDWKELMQNVLQKSITDSQNSVYTTLNTPPILDPSGKNSFNFPNRNKKDFEMKFFVKKDTPIRVLSLQMSSNPKAEIQIEEDSIFDSKTNKDNLLHSTDTLYVSPYTEYGHFRSVVDNSYSEIGSLFLSTFTADINDKLKKTWYVISVPFMLNHITKRGEIVFMKSELTTKHFMFVNCSNVNIVLDIPGY